MMLWKEFKVTGNASADIIGKKILINMSQVTSFYQIDGSTLGIEANGRSIEVEGKYEDIICAFIRPSKIPAYGYMWCDKFHELGVR